MEWRCTLAEWDCEVPDRTVLAHSTNGFMVFVVAPLGTVPQDISSDAVMRCLSLAQIGLLDSLADESKWVDHG